MWSNRRFSRTTSTGAAPPLLIEFTRGSAVQFLRRLAPIDFHRHIEMGSGAVGPFILYMERAEIRESVHIYYVGGRPTQIPLLYNI